MSTPVRIGVIGGSGVYAIEQLQDVEEVTVTTPFGAPSDAYIVGTLGGQRVAFLPRHGRGHRINPSRVNYRANIYGFKLLGVEYLIGVSACGSLREQIEPGHIMIPDQLFDRTHGRASSFFDDPAAGTDGLVAHISVRWRRPGLPCTAAAHLSPWKGRASAPRPRAASSARGAWTSSA
jgi:5'-methylthioadenosine phosphorylase